MKKSYLALVALGVSLLTSCSQEQFEPAGTDGHVTFAVQLPAYAQSRAYAEADFGKTLYYAAYEAGNANAAFVDSLDMQTSTQTKAHFDLVKGKTYDFIFWADKGATSPYTFSADGRTVSVSYDDAMVNDDTRDAFFAVKKGITVNGPMEDEVFLRRPFAQINVGTSDTLAAAKVGIHVASTSLSVSGAYKTLDLYTGEAGDADDVVFAAAAPANDETFPVEKEGVNYSYLAMAYVLTGVVVDEDNAQSAQSEVVNITATITCDDGHTIEVPVPNAPIQRNFRTNIYGALLTSPFDWNVTIEPTPEGSVDKNIDPWDGKSSEAPNIDEETKTGEISSAAQLQGLAELTSGSASRSGGNDYEGYTFHITSDIDFGGHKIMPIAAGADRSGSTAIGPVFKGVIEGNGHVLKNLVISDETQDVYTGFIANLAGSNAALKNVVFENVNFAAPNCEAVALVALLSEGATVENVTVKSGSFSGKQGVGAIAGRVLKNGHIKGCVNYADASCTTNNVGGIVGTAYYTQLDVAITIEDCENYGDIYAKNVSAGGIAGFSTADVTNCTNYGTIGAGNNSCGGIIGGQNARGVISGCVNEGDVIATATSSGFGGIIGWIRYESNATNYPNQSVIEVKSCENKGNINVSGSNANIASGIVGLVYRTAVISDCINTAKSISAANMVAGIAVYQNIGSACPNAENLLTVTGCESTTNTETQMTGSLKGEIVYDNTTGTNTALSNNKYNPAE
ncbi:MAG: hypothetical protein NC301_00860 [Bacteroides sp.]|nr:hypothetical protein [Bacteroides sp.]MCM1378838.1 hypothetical protein [Bacteroides sp.]